MQNLGDRLQCYYFRRLRLLLLNKFYVCGNDSFHGGEFVIVRSDINRWVYLFRQLGQWNEKRVGCIPVCV